MVQKKYDAVELTIRSTPVPIEPRRVVVRLRADLAVHYDARTLEAIIPSEIFERFPGIHVTTLTQVPEETLQELVDQTHARRAQVEKRAEAPSRKMAPARVEAEAAAYPQEEVPESATLEAAVEEETLLAVTPLPDYDPLHLLCYYAVSYPEGTEAAELAAALDNLEDVADAHVEGAYLLTEAVVFDGDTGVPRQRYLQPAPEGVDAFFAWEQPGGDGAGQRLVDIERGWKQPAWQHVDLASQNIILHSGHDDEGAAWHGTAVLGIVAAAANDTGCVGIAPGLEEVTLVSEWRAAGVYNLYDALLTAVTETLGTGDVLLLETQVIYGNNLLPIEVMAPLRTAIRTAVENGITVVEAAGNGGFNLDGVVNPANGHRFLRRDRPGFQDSGAIMVAAGHDPDDNAQWQRKSTSNYGSRIDCFAQGSDIYTSLVDSSQPDIRNGYYGGFGDTSGAAAIVAGVLLAFQGVVNARRAEPLPPQEVRAALKGTTPVPAQQIGEMPDLRTMIESLDLDD